MHCIPPPKALRPIGPGLFSLPIAQKQKSPAMRGLSVPFHAFLRGRHLEKDGKWFVQPAHLEEDLAQEYGRTQFLSNHFNANNKNLRIF